MMAGDVCLAVMGVGRDLGWLWLQFTAKRLEIHQ